MDETRLEIKFSEFFWNKNRYECSQYKWNISNGVNHLVKCLINLHFLTLLDGPL